MIQIAFTLFECLHRIGTIIPFFKNCLKYCYKNGQENTFKDQTLTQYSSVN